MTQLDYESMIQTALLDLDTMQNPGFKANLKAFAKTILKRSSANKDMIFWPMGMLFLGLSYANCSQDIIQQKLLSYTEKWSKKTDMKVSYVDDSVFGFASIRLYKQTGNAIYRFTGDKIFNFLKAYKKNPQGSIIYNEKAGNDYVFADGAGETAMFLSKYGDEIGVDEASALSATQLLNFYKNGIDLHTGLPYHAFSLSEDKKLGLVGWSRAMGWLLMGYSEFLSSKKNLLSHETSKAYDELHKQFISLCDVTLKYVRPDGGFSWMLQAIEGEADTSATAMIGYSMKKALNSNLYDRPEIIKSAVTRMEMFIISNTNDGSVNQALSGCEDLAVHRQVYDHYPWGQGPALALLSME